MEVRLDPPGILYVGFEFVGYKVAIVRRAVRECVTMRVEVIPLVDLGDDSGYGSDRVVVRILKARIHGRQPKSDELRGSRVETMFSVRNLADIKP